MDDDYKKRLQGNFKKLSDNMLVSEVDAYLFQNGVLTSEELETVSLSRGITPQEAARRLITILMKGENSNFSHLCTALRECQMGWLADDLENTDPDTVTLKKEDAYISDKDKMNALYESLITQNDKIKTLENEKAELQKQNADTTDSDKKLAEYCNNAGITQDEILDFIKALPALNGSDSPDGRFVTRIGSVESNIELQRQVSLHDPEQDIIAAIAKLVAQDTIYYMIGKESSYHVSTAQRYQETMRVVVEYMSTGKHATFMRLVNQVPMSNMNGYQTLFGIADALFEGEEITWGRITALYAFGAWVAKTSKNIELAELIISFLGYYVSKKLAPWIKVNGGWDGFCDTYNKDYDGDQAAASYRNNRLILLTMAGLAGLTAIIVKNST